MLEMYEFTYLHYLDLTERVEVIPRSLTYWEENYPQKLFGAWYIDGFPPHQRWHRDKDFMYFYRASKRW